MKPAVRKRRAPRHQGWALGIDVGATNVRAGLVHVSSGSIRCSHATPTEAEGGKRHSLARLALVAGQTVAAGKARGVAATLVGIGIPELVGNTGQIDSQCSLKWRAKDVHNLLQRYGAVTIASDVRAAALAEARLGAGTGAAVFLYVSVGTGISSTLVIDGEPFTGAHGHAISFASGPTFVSSDSAGHTTYAALESRAAGPGLLSRAQALGAMEEDAMAVCRKARQSAGLHRDIVDAAATELAIHVAVVANALDPTLIVMGGGLGSSSGRYWTTFRAAVHRHLWGPNSRRLPIRHAALGPRAGLIGAALAAVEARHS